MGRNKKNEQRKQKKREKHRKRREKAQAAERAKSSAPEPDFDRIPGPFDDLEDELEDYLDDDLMRSLFGERRTPAARVQVLGVSTEGCLPPVHLDGSGSVVPDPRVVLDLPAGPVSEARVRQAWKHSLIASPPEEDPEGARKAREARERLLDPQRFMEREVGVLHVPEPRQVEVQEQPSGLLDRGARLAGMAMLYGLVEEELWGQLSED